MRFNDKNRPSTDSIYNLPNFRFNRTTTMGFGNRKFLSSIKNSSYPSPSAYTIRSCFDYNVLHRKGFIISPKPCTTEPSSRRVPGVGTYNVSSYPNKKAIPIKIKSRLNFFYDDDLKKKKFTVSMQKYHPSLKLVLPCRYHNISFGLGTRTPNENISIKGNPGPGAYNIPGCFDKGLKGKPVLN